MNQKSPLLYYRIKCNSEPTVNEDTNYDIALGVWIDKSGEPIIKKYMERQLVEVRGETLITETREGIDRSEKSCTDESHNNDANTIGALGETLITRTRESVDRTERASEYNEPVFQTIQTFTRESVDRSEKS